MTNAKTLEREATKLLRRHGFTAAGRPRGEVRVEQVRFERRFILTPSNGQPRSGKKLREPRLSHA